MIIPTLSNTVSCKMREFYFRLPSKEMYQQNNLVLYSGKKTKTIHRDSLKNLQLINNDE